VTRSRRALDDGRIFWPATYSGYAGEQQNDLARVLVHRASINPAVLRRFASSVIAILLSWRG